MKITVFDDKLSILHTILGIITYFFPFLFILFFFYEFIEHLYKGRKDRFLGDLTEYFYGLAMISLIFLF